jgi:short-subunit dehydrogenase
MEKVMRTTTALITGASGGIGYEFAKLLARNCDTLVLVARSVDKLDEIKKELEAGAPVKIVIIPADLSLAGAANRLYEELEKERITVDILINNAGFGVHGAFVDRDWQCESNMIAVNVTALTHLTRFRKSMVAEGRIVNGIHSRIRARAVHTSIVSNAHSFLKRLRTNCRTGVTVTVPCRALPPPALHRQLAE